MCISFYVCEVAILTLLFCSWSNAAYVLNEVKRPVRTIKIAGPLGLGICTVLYLLANVAYFAAATPKEIANSGVTVAGFFFGQVFGKSAERALRQVGDSLFTLTFVVGRYGEVSTYCFDGWANGSALP